MFGRTINVLVTVYDFDPFEVASDLTSGLETVSVLTPEDADPGLGEVGSSFLIEGRTTFPPPGSSFLILIFVGLRGVAPDFT